MAGPEDFIDPSLLYQDTPAEQTDPAVQQQDPVIRPAPAEKPDSWIFDASMLGYPESKPPTVEEALRDRFHDSSKMGMVEEPTAGSKTDKLSDKVVVVCDNGLFVEYAAVLARTFGKVYYHCASGNAYRKMTKGLIGTGVEGLEILEDDIWEVNPDLVDLWVFPDVNFGHLQEELRSRGHRVWGSGSGEAMENDRVGMKQDMAEQGMPVGEYEVVKGIDNLRVYLKENEDVFIKISKWRGSFESFHAKNYRVVEAKLDRIQQELGPLGKITEFIIEQPLPDRVEIGVDCWTVDGKYPKNLLAGIEVKDCYDDQTEVLTDKGWKLFRDLDRSEQILTLNMSDSRHMKLEYQTPTDYIAQDYDDKLLYIESQNLDMAVTPNHKLLIQKNSQDPSRRPVTWTGYDGVKRTFRPAKRNRVLERVCDIDLTKWFSMPHPTSAMYSGRGDRGSYKIKSRVRFGDVSIPMVDYCRLMGMYLSEGHTKRTETGKGWAYWVSISQEKYHEEFAEVLLRLGLGFKKGRAGVYFHTSNQALGEHLHKFGLSADKYVPDEIRYSGYRNIREFLKYYCLGDGSTSRHVESPKRCRIRSRVKSTRTFYTKSKIMADHLQELMIKTGSPSIIVNQANEYGDFYVVNEHTRQLKNWVLPHQHEWRHYTGKIYCVTVPNHIICVRRNGKPVWSGNSGYVGAFGPMAKLPKPIHTVNKGLAPIFKRYGYRGPFSTEIRTNGPDDAYLIDSTCRLPSPPNEIYQEMYLNAAEIAWHGANGVMIEPKPRAKFGAQLVLSSSWCNENWQPVYFPKELREYVKLINQVVIDGIHYTSPQCEGLDSIGGVIGFGDTAEEAGEAALEHAKEIEGPGIDYSKDAIKEAIDAAKKAEEMGIKIF